MPRVPSKPSEILSRSNLKRANGAFPACKADCRGFKALKQLTKMNFLQMHQPAESLTTYKELLTYTKVGSIAAQRLTTSRVLLATTQTSLSTTSSIMSGVRARFIAVRIMLTRQHATVAPDIPLDTLEQFYEATRVACIEGKNEVGYLIERTLMAAVVDQNQSQARQVVARSQGVCPSGSGQ